MTCINHDCFDFIVIAIDCIVCRTVSQFLFCFVFYCVGGNDDQDDDDDDGGASADGYDGDFEDREVTTRPMTLRKKNRGRKKA